MHDHYLFCFIFRLVWTQVKWRQRIFFWLINFRHHSYFSVGRKTFKLLSIKTGLIVKQNKIPARLNWSMYLSIAFVWWGIKMSNYILEMIERVSTSSDNILRLLSNQKIENISQNYSLNNFELFLSILRKYINVNGYWIIKKLKRLASNDKNQNLAEMFSFWCKQNNGNVLPVRSKVID